MLAPGLGPDQKGDLLAAYDYDLPQELIAQGPARRRVQARMLVLPRAGGGPAHSRVAQLTRFLWPGDLLVLNRTKVVPARLWAQKETGGRVEILLLSPAQPEAVGPDGGETHQVLLKGKGLKAGARLRLPGEPPVWVTVLDRGERGKARVAFPGPAMDVAIRQGEVPLPPYIKRPQGPNQADRRRYQTVYAGQPGAVAAPTAGLHLSAKLLKALEARGVRVAGLTLHVGYGTFAEPSPADLAAGRLHPEWVEIGEDLGREVARTRQEGGRVVAVGTTCVRALEWRAGPGGSVRPGQGWCGLMIGEGNRFKVVDGLMTNFHLPRTTLLMLVAAFAGRERLLAAYAEAIERRYRFYSFGDAMLMV